MTIRELYELALAHDCADGPIAVDYYCGDQWYDVHCQLTVENIYFFNGKTVITVDND